MNEPNLSPKTSVEVKETVLVTGGAGFVGSNLCKALLREGFLVYAVDNLITGHKSNIVQLLDNRNFQFLKLDVIDQDFVDAFAVINLDHIYHLACPTGVPNIEKLGEEMLLTSSIGTLNVLELARLHGAKLLFSSTAEVYGDPQVTPQTEDYCGHVHPLCDRAPYEEGKRFSESVVNLYARKYNVEAKIARIFNTYGPGMSLSDTRVIPRFLQAVVSGDSLCVYGDGSQTRTHLYIDDLIRGLRLVLDEGVPGEAYNVGGESQTTISDLAEIVLRLSGQGDIVYKPHFIRDHQHRQPCVKRAKSLGWKQTVSLEDGIRKMMEANYIPFYKPQKEKAFPRKAFGGAGA